MLKKIKGVTLCLSGMSLAFALSTPAQANPTGPDVRNGSVNIRNPASGQMEIHQLTDRAIINWNGFSINASEVVKFIQPSQLSAILNRVTGGDPSVILGSLIANGKVFLINPNGIVFGQGANVDVGSLFASTLNLTDKDFLDGRYKLDLADNQALAPIINEGTLRIAPGGYLVLAAPLVSNQGIIIANLGQVALGAATKMEVNFDGQGLINLVLDGATANPGTVALSHGMVNNMVGDLLNVNPLDQIVDMTDGGKSIIAGEGTLVNAGEIHADGAAGRDAGRVIMNSSKGTYLLDDSVVSANGIGIGSNGGEVRVISEGLAILDSGAKLEAKGGQTGNGGFVEFSGHRDFALAGSIDITAEAGHSGTLLLDPGNLTIVNGGPGTLDGNITNTTQGLNAGANATQGTVSNTFINNFPANGTLTLQATNNITNGSGPTTANINPMTNTTINFLASAGNIILSGLTQVNPTGTNVTYNFTAGQNFVLNNVTATTGVIDSSGGTVRVTAGNTGTGDLVLNTTILGRDVVLNAANTITNPQFVGIDRASNLSLSAPIIGSAANPIQAAGPTAVNGVFSPLNLTIGGGGSAFVDTTFRGNPVNLQGLSLTSGNIVASGQLNVVQPATATGNLALTSTTGNVVFTGTTTAGSLNVRAGRDVVVQDDGNVLAGVLESQNITLDATQDILLADGGSGAGNGVLNFSAGRNITRTVANGFGANVVNLTAGNDITNVLIGGDKPDVFLTASAGNNVDVFVANYTANLTTTHVGGGTTNGNFAVTAGNGSINAFRPVSSPNVTLNAPGGAISTVSFGVNISVAGTQGDFSSLSLLGPNGAVLVGPASTLTFTNNNPAVLSIDPATGHMVALSPGVTVISATLAGNSFFTPVTVDGSLQIHILNNLPFLASNGQVTGNNVTLNSGTTIGSSPLFMTTGANILNLNSSGDQFVRQTGPTSLTASSGTGAINFVDTGALTTRVINNTAALNISAPSISIGNNIVTAGALKLTSTTGSITGTGNLTSNTGAINVTSATSVSVNNLTAGTFVIVSGPGTVTANNLTASNGFANVLSTAGTASATNVKATGGSATITGSLGATGTNVVATGGDALVLSQNGFATGNLINATGGFASVSASTAATGNNITGDFATVRGGATANATNVNAINGVQIFSGSSGVSGVTGGSTTGVNITSTNGSIEVSAFSGGTSMGTNLNATNGHAFVSSDNGTAIGTNLTATGGDAVVLTQGTTPSNASGTNLTSNVGATVRATGSATGNLLNAPNIAVTAVSGNATATNGTGATILVNATGAATGRNLTATSNITLSGAPIVATNISAPSLAYRSTGVVNVFQNGPSTIAVSGSNATVVSNGTVTVGNSSATNNLDISTTAGSIEGGPGQLAAPNVTLSSTGGIGSTTAVNVNANTLNAQANGNVSINEADGATVTGNTTGEFRMTSGGNLIVNSIKAGPKIQLDVVGSILSGNTTAPNLQANAAVLNATGSIGQASINNFPRNQAGALRTDVQSLDANSSNGSVFISEANDLTLGLVSAPGSVGIRAGGAIVDGNGEALNVKAGNDSSLTAGRTIGTEKDPIDVDVTGKLSVGTGEKSDGVSVAINGRVSPADGLDVLDGFSSFAGLPPGLVLFNGRVPGNSPDAEKIKNLTQDPRNVNLDPFLDDRGSVMGSYFASSYTVHMAFLLDEDDWLRFLEGTVIWESEEDEANGL